MRIIREKTAAVCVDYQERILPAMTDPETLLQNTVKLLEGLRVLGVPVYLTQQYTKGLGDTVAPIREAAGTSEHLEKLTFSAYPPAFWSVGCLKGKSEPFRRRFALFTTVRSADFPLFPSSPARSGSVLGQKWVRENFEITKQKLSSVCPI